MFSAVTATVSMNWVIDVQGRQTTFLKKMRSKERKKERKEGRNNLPRPIYVLPFEYFVFYGSFSSSTTMMKEIP